MMEKPLGVYRYSSKRGKRPRYEQPWRRDATSVCALCTLSKTSQRSARSAPVSRSSLRGNGRERKKRRSRRPHAGKRAGKKGRSRRLPGCGETAWRWMRLPTRQRAGDVKRLTPATVAVDAAMDAVVNASLTPATVRGYDSRGPRRTPRAARDPLSTRLLPRLSS